MPLEEPPGNAAPRCAAAPQSLAPQAPTTWRMFVALPTPDSLRAGLETAQRSLARHLPPRSMRWANSSQIHLTLHFLGNVESRDVEPLVAALRAAAAGTGPIALAPAQFGCFPGEHRARVFWLGLAGDIPRLFDLQKRVAAAVAAFGDHREDRPFQPHITFGRAAAHPLRLDPDWARGIECSMPDRWTADHVLLVRSQLDPSGARHTTIATVYLDP